LLFVVMVVFIFVVAAAVVALTLPFPLYLCPIKLHELLVLLLYRRLLLLLFICMAIVWSLSKQKDCLVIACIGVVVVVVDAVAAAWLVDAFLPLNLNTI
jgi:hypothetical protein